MSRIARPDPICRPLSNARFFFAAVPLLVLMVSGCELGRKSSAPEPASRVPNVVGMSWPDAANRIGASGLCFRWGTITNAGSGTRVGRVTGQRPRAGQRVPRLSQVVISVSRIDDGRLKVVLLYEIDQDPACPNPGLPTFVGFPF